MIVISFFDADMMVTCHLIVDAKIQSTSCKADSETYPEPDLENLKNKMWKINENLSIAR